MKFFKSTLGYMIAGMLVMSVWDSFADSYGIFGGFFAAFIIIGPMWFMNHYVELIDQTEGVAFVDMALGIGIAGIFRDFFLSGTSELIASLPTLLLVVIGGALGGLAAGLIEKDMKKDSSSDELKEHVENELNVKHQKNRGV